MAMEDTDKSYILGRLDKSDDRLSNLEAAFTAFKQQSKDDKKVIESIQEDVKEIKASVSGIIKLNTFIETWFTKKRLTVVFGTTMVCISIVNDIVSNLREFLNVIT